MDFVGFADISFRPNTSIGRLCEDLNNIVGYGIWYDTFQVQNAQWLWLVKYIVTALNSDKVLCGCFGLYPSYVSGIQSYVKEIHFYVISTKKLHYCEYIEKCIAGNKCSISYTKHADCYFHLFYGGNTIALSFTARQFRKLPSELIFAQSVLKECVYRR